MSLPGERTGERFCVVLCARAVRPAAVAGPREESNYRLKLTVFAGTPRWAARRPTWVFCRSRWRTGSSLQVGLISCSPVSYTRIPHLSWGLSTTLLTHPLLGSPAMLQEMP